MILNVWRVFRNLAWYHHVMIIITVLVPLIWSGIITLWLPDGLVLKVILHLAALPAFFVLAELAVAVALRSDRSKAAQFVSQEVDVVSGEIRTLREQHGDVREQHGDVIGDLRRQIDDQDQVFRSAFEDLGVVLPGRRISVSAKPVAWNIMVSEATGAVTGGSKWARLRRLFQSFRLWLKETVWGKPDHQ